MTSRTINYTITAQSQIDQVMNQIAGAVQNMGNVSAAQIPKLAKEIANAQAATTRAASAIEQYRQNLLKTDIAQQHVTAAQNAVAASAERVRREALQTAAAEQALAAATLRTQTAWTSAASAASRYAEQAARAGHVNAGGGLSGGDLTRAGATAGVVGGLTQGVLGLIKDGLVSVAQAIGATGERAVSLASDLELTKAAFTSMTGSAAVADRTLGAIRQYADDSIFEFPQLSKAVAGFEGVGQGSKSALASVRDLGAEIQGRGKDAETLDRIALAQQQVISKGRLMGDEAQQFAEAGLPVWQILASYLNTDTASAQALSEQGRITADVWSKALHTDAVQNFANASEQAGKSWAAMSSTLSDTINSRLADFGQGVMEGLKPAIQDITTLLKDPGVVDSIKEWSREVGGFFQQIEQGAKLFAQLFGLQLPQIQQQKNDLADVGDQWNTISVNMGDVKAQTQALKDSEEGIKAGAEATNRAYEGKIQRLRDAATASEREYDAQSKIAQLNKLSQDMARNAALSKNIFTSEGRAAALKLEEEGEQKNQLLREMGHTAQKNALADSITALERQKQAAAQQAQDQIAAVERNITGIQREAAAYDDYNRAKLDAINKYRKALEDADTGAAASVGVRALGTEVGVQSGLLPEFTARIKELVGPTALGAITTTVDNITGAFRAAGPIVTGLADDLGKLIAATGIDTGVAGAFKAGEAAARTMFGAFAEGLPQVEALTGRTMRNIANSIGLAVRALTAGVAGLRAIGPGATEQDRQAFADAADAFQTQLTNAGNDATAPLNTPRRGQGGATVGTPSGAIVGRPGNTQSGGGSRDVQVTVGFDESTNAMKVVRSVIKQSGDAVDQALGSVWGR